MSGLCPQYFIRCWRIRDIVGKVRTTFSQLYVVLALHSTLHPGLGGHSWLEYTRQIWKHADECHCSKLFALEWQCLSRVVHIPRGFPNANPTERWVLSKCNTDTSSWLTAVIASVQGNLLSLMNSCKIQKQTRVHS